MESDSFFKIGYVAKTHGLKGGVTMVIALDCPDLSGVRSVFIQINQQFVPHFIESMSSRGTKVFLKLEDINTPEQAALLKGGVVFLPKSDRPKLARGEFYTDEVIGFKVIDREKGILGSVIEVAETGPGRHLVILHDNKEIMIPLNSPFIKRLDKAKRSFEVELPEGFLEI